MKPKPTGSISASQARKPQDRMTLINKHIDGHFDKVNGGYKAKSVPTIHWDEWGIIGVLVHVLNTNIENPAIDPITRRIRKKVSFGDTLDFDGLRDTVISDKDMNEIKAAFASSKLKIRTRVLFPSESTIKLYYPEY